jgi:hypothetical protein
MFKKIAAQFLLASLPMTAFADITDGKFGASQIFDVQWSISGSTLSAWNFIAPYDSTFTPVIPTQGQYFQFVRNNDGSYGLNLYNSNGILSRVIHSVGEFIAIGGDSIFYIGSYNYGTLITPSGGYAYGGSLNSEVAENPTEAQLLTYVWASTRPLGVGEIPSSGPAEADTRMSMIGNAQALLHVFNLQSAKTAQGLSYDCTVYDQKNICVSFVGSKSDGKGFNVTTGALILAHTPTGNFRFGGYIDQSSGSSISSGLTVKRGSPGFGAFGVWSQNADGSGVEVRASANVGKMDMDTTRTAVDSAEAGFGKSNIKSSGFQLEVSRDYAINNAWSARPYLGYRKTTNKRAGYTETDAVEFPLTYSSLKQNTETALVGVRLGHQFSQNTALTLSAGVEHDLKNKIDNYLATNPDMGDIDSIDMGSNKRKTRPMVSFSLNHNLDKNQRIGVSVTHRKDTFNSAASTSAMVQYSVGF